MTELTKESLAAILDNREIGREISRAEASAAKDAGLVVVYGASDDLMEFTGAFDDEIGCYEGGTTWLDRHGIVDTCQGADKNRLSYTPPAAYRRVIARWCAPDGPPWTYETDIPHTCFTIVEDGEPYCRGIVFSIAELR